MVQLSYPDHLKERQTTFQLLLSKEEQTTLAKHRHPDKLHSASAPQYIRAISMCHPDIIIRIPLRICIVQLSYPDRLKERQTTFQRLLSKEEQTTLAERRHPDSLHNTSG